MPTLFLIPCRFYCKAALNRMLASAQVAAGGTAILSPTSLLQSQCRSSIWLVLSLLTHCYGMRCTGQGSTGRPPAK